VVAVDLTDLPEVFEVRFALTPTNQQGSIHLLGRDDKTLHQRSFPLPSANADNVLYVIPKQEIFAFPSELMINERTRLFLEFGVSKPVLNLLAMTDESGNKQSITRIWIDSDAPACISAFNSISESSRIIDLFDLYPKDDHRVVEKIFDPYTGGLVRNFRNGRVPAKSSRNRR
jgi:hypothetical protein